MDNMAEAAPAQKLSARIRSLAPKYLEQRNLEVESIAELVQAGNFERIVFIAHKMNGSGAGYGFPELSDMAAELEEAAELKDEELIKTHALALLQTLGRLRATGR